ncbi:MAG: KamA family radical SAM protein [Treponema sp.]|jgi:lysine 2,3-aminomutase|nr:KamA family radical SAM protein [Treponema sp.]
MQGTLITSIDELPPLLRASVSPEEAEYLETIQLQGLLPFRVTPHFASLAGTTQDDPIRRQFFPDPREAWDDPFGLSDPLGEALYRTVPRLVHQYRDRALLLAGGICAGYCRYCFRRVWIAQSQEFISETEVSQVLGYLKNHAEIRELLISGGDPLTGTDEKLAWLFRELRSLKPTLLLRLCTRTPITNPYRLTPELIGLLKASRPLRMVVHLNHPREMAEQTKKALADCLDAGIPIHVQTVLLRGVNDDAEILALLFRECLELGLSPYYLFQLDLAPGTAHFRVPLKQGLALYQKLKTQISGLGLPKYTVDLPGGGGKISLHDSVIIGTQDDPRGKVYVLCDHDGKRWTYPVE